MFCKWCGMESETSDVCSWCRKPFSVTATAVEVVPPSDEVLSDESGVQPPAPEATAPATKSEVVFDLTDFEGAVELPGADTLISEPLSPVDESAGTSVSGESEATAAFDAEFDDDLNPLSFGGVMGTQIDTAAAPAGAETEASVDASTAASEKPETSAEEPTSVVAEVAPPEPVVESAPAVAAVPSPSVEPPSAPVPAPQASPVRIPVEPTRSEAANQPVEGLTGGTKPVQSPGAPLGLKRPVTPAPPVTPPVKPIAKDRVGPVYTPPAVHKPADRPDLEAIPIRKPGGGQAPPPVIPISRSGKAKPAPAVPLRPTTPAVAKHTQAPMPPAVPVAGEPLAPPEPKPTAKPMAGGPIPLGDVEEVMPILGGLRAPERPARPLGEALAEDDLPAGPIGIPANLTAPGAPVAPPPERVPSSNLPKAGGRTWYCRWCGMESDNPDRCSWCHKDLRQLPAAHPAQPAGHNHSGNRGGKQKGHVAPAVPPVRPGAVSAPTPTVGVPQMGTFEAQKSKYYQDVVVDPVSGAHYDTDTGRAKETPVVSSVVEDMALEERRDLLQQLGRYAGVLVAIVLVTTGLAAMVKPMYLLWLALANLAGCIVLPVLRVVPFAEDDSDDIALAGALMLVLGPVVGGVVYGVACVLRSTFNPGIAAVFLVYLLTRVPIDAAVGNGALSVFHASMPWAKPADATWTNHLLALWMTFAGVAGWYGAALFHKLDE